MTLYDEMPPRKPHVTQEAVFDMPSRAVIEAQRAVWNAEMEFYKKYLLDNEGAAGRTPQEVIDEIQGLLYEEISGQQCINPKDREDRYRKLWQKYGGEQVDEARRNLAAVRGNETLATDTLAELENVKKTEQPAYNNVFQYTPDPTLGIPRKFPSMHTTPEQFISYDIRDAILLRTTELLKRFVYRTRKGVKYAGERFAGGRLKTKVDEVRDKVTGFIDRMTPESTGERFSLLRVGVAERQGPYRVYGDRVMQDKKRGLFGVFDGVGSTDCPDRAPEAIEDAVRAYYDALTDRRKTHRQAEQEMRDAMECARERVVALKAELRQSGETTDAVGTFVKFNQLPDGTFFCTVGHVGDTRMFVYNKRADIGMTERFGLYDEMPSSPLDSYRALTEDQSNRNIVFNTFGSSQQQELDQVVSFDLMAGDKVMLCSDGITGDTPEQGLTKAEFLYCFGWDNPKECAQLFLAKSKKQDDKSVLVIDTKALFQ